MPKNIATNVLKVDKTHVKLRKSSDIRSQNLRLEVSQNQVTNSNENVEEPSDSMKKVLRYLSNEVAAILQDKKYLNAQTDTDTR